MSPQMKISSTNFITRSAEETRALGERLSLFLKKNDVVLLMAGLGSGKTTLVQGIAQGWGVKEKAMSPTFILAQTLEPNKKNKTKGPLHHLDFYRLDKKEIWDMGIQDYMQGGGIIEPGIVLIEWADLCPEIWPDERLEIKISIQPQSKERRFQIKGKGKNYQDIVKKLIKKS